MRAANDFNEERYNEANAEKAFAALGAQPDWDVARWAILKRYAEIRQGLFCSTDTGTLNRAAGKLEELEWVLERLGEPLYGGLPLADGIPGAENVQGLDAEALGIGGGYPGGSGSRPPLGIPE